MMMKFQQNRDDDNDIILKSRNRQSIEGEFTKKIVNSLKKVNSKSNREENSEFIENSRNRWRISEKKVFIGIAKQKVNSY